MSRTRPARLLTCIACASLPVLVATSRASGTFNQLTYINGSTVKVEQLIGDHDWADTTRTVRSRTLSTSDVLGTDVGMSFMDGDSLIVLFGDTIGATQQYVPGWARTLDPYKWDARDPVAWSTTSQPDSALLLHFFTNAAGDSTLIVAPVYPDGTPLAMGIDDVPNAGIVLDGKAYVIVKTGNVNVGGVNDNSNDSSVVVRFRTQLKTFTAGRTLSRLQDGGRYLTTSLRELPTQFASSPSDSEVLIFGLGKYRQSDVYLSMIPKADFVSGVDSHGVSATRYFAGLAGTQPTWSDTVADARPIVQDDPLSDIGVGVPQLPWPNDTPTIGNLSVVWSPALGLWLMTYDGGRQPKDFHQTNGIYFTYALAPWGPWQKPQLIFNMVRDSAQGTYIRHYDHTTQVGAGPAGPTIGDQSSNDPDTTSGANYAPGILERFVRVVGDTLKLDYTLSTWNPYTIVRMRSEFLVSVQPLDVTGPPPVAPLAASRPNPFRTTTRVRFATPRPGTADVRIFDLEGRLVRRLLSAVLPAGPHEAEWDGRSDAGSAVRPGLYLVRVRAAGADVVSRVARIE